jgi:hypothetical protein
MNPKEEIVAVRFAGPSDVRVDQRLLRPNDAVGTDSKLFLFSASVDIGYSLDGPCYRAEDDSNTYDGYGSSSAYGMAAEKPSEEAEEKKDVYRYMGQQEGVLKRWAVNENEIIHPNDILFFMALTVNPLMMSMDRFSLTTSRKTEKSTLNERYQRLSKQFAEYAVSGTRKMWMSDDVLKCCRELEDEIRDFKAVAVRYAKVNWYSDIAFFVLPFF